MTCQGSPSSNQEKMCLLGITDEETHFLELGWRVADRLILPPKPLISNPPPPGVYSGPRLLAFAQLWDEADRFLAGDDGLWVDPYTLQPGDIFVCRERRVNVSHRDDQIVNRQAVDGGLIQRDVVQARAAFRYAGHVVAVDDGQVTPD